MKKRLLKVINGDNSLLFAIKREVLVNGSEHLTPVVKYNAWFQPWMPIVKVNERYEATDIYTNFQHTEKSCIEYIEAYRDQVAKENGTKIKETVYQVII